MASLEKAVEEPLDILCEFRRYKSLEAAGNNDNKNPTASSVEQVRIQWFLNSTGNYILLKLLYLLALKFLIRVSCIG